MGKISEKATVAATAVIHEDVVIEEGVVIHDYVVLYPGTVIRRGAEIFDHCILGKLPTSPGSTAKTYSSEHGITEIGEESILCPGAVIYTGTSVGHHTLLGDHCSIREKCRVGNYCIISRLVTVNYETTIGNHTKIMDNAHITGNMTIGNHVFISVLVATTNDNSMGRSEDAADHLAGPVIDKDDAGGFVQVYDPAVGGDMIQEIFILADVADETIREQIADIQLLYGAGLQQGVIL